MSTSYNVHMIRDEGQPGINLSVATGVQRAVVSVALRRCAQCGRMHLDGLTVACVSDPTDVGGDEVEIRHESGDL